MMYKTPQTLAELIRPLFMAFLLGLISIGPLALSAFAGPEAARSAAALAPMLRSQHEHVFHGRSPSSSLDENIIFEDFNNRLFPPQGWTIQTANTNDPTYTWFGQDYWSSGSHHEGAFNAGVLWDSTGAMQDEWLISPVFSIRDTLPGEDSVSWDLSFNWMMSYYWGVSPHDNYDLELRLSLDGGASFPVVLWTEDSVTTATFVNFEWYTATVDLYPYFDHSNARLAWRYHGEDGAEAGIDYISFGIPREKLGIPDPGSATWLIDVSTLDIIEDLDVSLKVSHQYISDLTFTLKKVNGDSIELVERTEYDTLQFTRFTNTRFDDQAATPFTYSTGTDGFAGSWIPFEPLSTFNGISAQGEWMLIAVDNAAEDTGYVSDVSLYINSHPPVDADTFVVHSDETEEITHLSVILNVTHPMISELVFILENPSGQPVTLVNEEQYNLTGANFVNTRFDDSAVDSFAYVDGISDYTGSWIPAEPLSSFNGQSPTGDWKLIAIDIVPGNDGTIDNVELEIEVLNTPFTDPAIPASIQFYGNYPNPFNPSTTLTYDLPITTHVSLNIYNTLGQHVAALLNEQVNAGSHAVQFDGVNLASGIYFAIFDAGDYHQTHKMILLK